MAIAGNVPNCSSTLPRRSSACSGSLGSANGGGAPRRNLAEMFFCQRDAFLTFTSPSTSNTALFGT